MSIGFLDLQSAALELKPAGDMHSCHQEILDFSLRCQEHNVASQYLNNVIFWPSHRLKAGLTGTMSDHLDLVYQYDP